tara:strand:+ start:1146 stop:1439 length:294 start_codon:yes stop_codon:yes gene_type:complete
MIESLTFIKTNHFIHRQKERFIPNTLLIALQRRIKRAKKTTAVIISRQLLLNYGIRKNMELFLIVNDQVFITGYYQDVTEYFLQEKKHLAFQLINKT